MIWLLACATTGGLAGDYQEVHQEWTQELRFAHDFELDLIVRATLIEGPVAAAQAAYLSAARLEGPGDEAARLAESAAQAQQEFVVVFSAYSPYTDAREFAPDASAAWTVRLLVDGRPQPAIEVTELRDPSPDLQALYPQLNRWSALWVARFERVDGGREVEFQVAGVHGRGALTWAL